MVQRYEFCRWSNDEAGMQDESEGEWVKYEDYAKLKAHADAMCEAMCLYDLGERVSFDSYRLYAEWRAQND